MTVRVDDQQACVRARKSFRAAIGTLVFPMIGLLPSDSTAQVKVRRGFADVEDPTRLLSAMERGQVMHRSIVAAFRTDRLVDDTTLEVGNYNRYTAPQRRQLLDGLERIARGFVTIQGDASTQNNVLGETFGILETIGLNRDIPESREIPRMLLRVYRGTESDDLKFRAVMKLGRVLGESPGEASEITDLLVSLITQPVDYPFARAAHKVPVGPVWPLPALAALVRSCEVAVPVLRRLHTELEVQDIHARQWIDEAAQEGFDPTTWQDPFIGWYAPCR